MKVLLTGAGGFVGSHILDCLRSRGIATAALVRQGKQLTSPETETRTGSLEDLPSLRKAMAGITHVIHCAGATKARRVADFFSVNQTGTRNLVEATNEERETVRRFVLISSLAAAGPAYPERPARETDPPEPVSVYGRSKLAGETELRIHCQVEHVILRPPAVYGPGDAEFLRMFLAVKRHLLPLPGNPQPLSLVYARDLAEAAVGCLEHPAAAGKIYFVACPEVVTARAMAREIARCMNTWTVPCPVPSPVLWLMCLLGQIGTRVTGKANVLSLQKYAELRAPGWVCDPTLMQRELGFTCSTQLQSGIEQTLRWYQAKRWL
jgi:nucleoside-diphosphate-sugar epimerase